MKLIYLTVDGRATVENYHMTSEQMVEMPDGYHPITNDSIWQDAKRIREPLMVILQGVRGPYGATMEQEDISRLLFDQKLREKAFKGPNVSKVWWRLLQQVAAWFMKYIVMIAMGIIIAWVLYDAFAPKGGY